MTFRQIVIIDLSGLVLGAASAIASVVVVSKELTGAWVPYLTWPPMVVIGASAVGVTAAAILAPTLWLISRPLREG